MSMEGIILTLAIIAAAISFSILAGIGFELWKYRLVNEIVERVKIELKEERGDS